MQTTKETKQLKEFFETVWGDDPGMRIISTKTRGGVWKDSAYDTNETALKAAQDAIRDGIDCFFGLHLFDGENRLATSAIGCRALYLDIDIKPNDPKCYSSTGDAVSALMDFTERTGMPCPTVVTSGNGLHIYWFLESLLNETAWGDSARQLKTLFRVQGLKADASVTADAARVLRTPESRNYKDGDNPRAVEIVLPGKALPFHSLKEILSESATPDLAKNTTEQNDEFLSGIESDCVDPQKSRDIARLCVTHLNRERWDDYDGWLNVGIALHNVFAGGDNGLRLWDDWSKSGVEYKAGVCHRKWEGFAGSSGDGLSVGSLVHWAKADSNDFPDAWEKYKADRRLERLAGRCDEIQLTDYGNAQRLVALYGNNLRYDHTHAIWYFFNGQFWQADADQQVKQYAKGTVKAMYVEASKTADDARRQTLTKHALRSESANSLKAIVKLAESEPELQVDISDFDKHPDYLNVKNGIIELTTGRLLPHSREMMFSSGVPIEYDPHAKCPIFEAFLRRIFAGNLRLIEYLRRAIGYTLTGENKEQVLFICHGEGANGKSTLLETIHYLLGDHAGTVRTEALMKHKFTGQNGHNDDIASLAGKRFVAATETEQGQQFAESHIKQLTGGDTITASRKYGRSFSFQPRFKLWVAANHKPAISGTDEGIWRRIRFLPFEQRIPENERDTGLKDKLQAEAQGILAWAVRGAVEWYADGLGTSPEVERATMAYRNEQDSVSIFIEDCCNVGVGRTAQPAFLFTEYQQWCALNGDEQLNRRTFPARLKAIGFSQKPVKVGMQTRTVWQGLSIKPPHGFPVDYEPSLN